MDKILHSLLDLRSLHFGVDDDLVDRLSRLHTTCFLTLVSALVSMRQYFGETIHCWCPEQCASNHEKYANLYCWVEDTYYIAFDQKLPQMGEEREQMITYYQWTPIILVLQAFFFFFPFTLWRALNRRSGVNICNVIEASASCQMTSSESRDKTLRHVVMLMDRYLMTQRDMRRGFFSRLKRTLSKHCLLFCGRLYGNYLVCCYVIVKILYVINAVGQLFFLDVLLGYEYHMYGIQVLRHFLYGAERHHAVRFPRVTLCDFYIRQHTNVHQYTVQCVLPINIFNEKIFTLVWFWYFAVAVLTFISLLYWSGTTLYWPGQITRVKRQLRSMEAKPKKSALLRKFTETYLRRDGLFILRLVGKNAGELVATEVLSGLWDVFLSRSQRQENCRELGRKTNRAASNNSPVRLNIPDSCVEDV